MTSGLGGCTMKSMLSQVPSQVMSPATATLARLPATHLVASSQTAACNLKSQTPLQVNTYDRWQALVIAGHVNTLKQGGNPLTEAWMSQKPATAFAPTLYKSRGSHCSAHKADTALFRARFRTMCWKGVLEIQQPKECRTSFTAKQHACRSGRIRRREEELLLKGSGPGTNLAANYRFGW